MYRDKKSALSVTRARSSGAAFDPKAQKLLICDNYITIQMLYITASKKKGKRIVGISSPIRNIKGGPAADALCLAISSSNCKALGKRGDE